MGVKLRLVPDPTFQTNVKVPLKDGGSADVLMTFKHRTRVELAEFIKSIRAPDIGAEGSVPPEKSPDQVLDDDVDLFLQMVVGWDLEDEFNRDNVRTMLNNYFGAWAATYYAYLEAQHRATVGN